MEPKEGVAVVVATAFCRLVAIINQTMQSKTEIAKKKYGCIYKLRGVHNFKYSATLVFVEASDLFKLKSRSKIRITISVTIR